MKLAGETAKVKELKTRKAQFKLRVADLHRKYVEKLQRSKAKNKKKVGDLQQQLDAKSKKEQ